MDFNLRWAVLENLVVINMIMWEGQEISPVDWASMGWEAVFLGDRPVDYGWTYSHETGEFTPPN